MKKAFLIIFVGVCIGCKTETPKINSFTNHYGIILAVKPDVGGFATIYFVPYSANKPLRNNSFAEIINAQYNVGLKIYSNNIKIKKQLFSTPPSAFLNDGREVKAYYIPNVKIHWSLDRQLYNDETSIIHSIVSNVAVYKGRDSINVETYFSHYSIDSISIGNQYIE